jgi:hypothetical protein
MRALVFEFSFAFENAHRLAACFNCLPKDARIVNYRRDEFDRMFGFLVESEEFPEVIEGKMIPRGVFIAHNDGNYNLTVEWKLREELE